jgi:hypothetical protein
VRDRDDDLFLLNEVLDRDLLGVRRRSRAARVAESLFSASSSSTDDLQLEAVAREDLP